MNAEYNNKFGKLQSKIFVVEDWFMSPRDLANEIPFYPS